MSRIAGVLVCLVLLATGSRPAEARSLEFGADIIDLGPAPDAETSIMYTRVGYRFQATSLFGLDLWRSDGQFVLYSGQSSSLTIFRPLEAETAAALGYRTPWKYHLPPGVLILACLLEVWILARKRRPAKLVLGIGGALIAISLILYLGGLTWEVLVPLALGAYHLVRGVSAARGEREVDDIDAETIEAPRARRPEPEPLRPPPPNVETDPFRAPPQPPPIAVQRPSAARAHAPIVRDESADKPKLLT